MYKIFPHFCLLQIIIGRGTPPPHIILFIDFYIKAIESNAVSFSGIIEP